MKRNPLFSVFLAGLCLLVALAIFFAGSSMRIKPLVGLVPLALGLVIVAVSATTIIQAKNVGVLTTFGKPSGSLDAGLHFKMPWQKVTELDGTKITNKYEG